MSPEASMGSFCQKQIPAKEIGYGTALGLTQVCLFIVGKKKTMTMTKIPSRKPSGTYGHGPLKICFWKGKDDDHDHDFLKNLLHIWSWSSDINLLLFIVGGMALKQKDKLPPIVAVSL